jgi:hypothetical protein
VRTLAGLIAEENFREAEDGCKPIILGTGGYGRLFEAEALFNAFIPELPLLGLRRAIELSRDSA